MVLDQKNSTVLLVDDHALMRKGLRALIEGEPGLTVAGEAGDGEQAIEQARALSPDIVVMDVSMPNLNGIDATRRLLAEAPESKVLALSIHSERRFVEEMLQAGAAGYVLKDSAPEELVRAIHALLRGEPFLSAPLVGTLITSFHQRSTESNPVQDAGGPSERLADSALPVSDRADAAVPEFEPAVTPPQVLRTKLYPPALPTAMVPRTDLLDRLEAGKRGPLALVSAPAGYGKSLLIGSWLECCGWTSAWLSLDDGDSDLRQFMSDLVAAVRTRFPEACGPSDTLTKAHELPSVKTLSATLSNDLDALTEPLILALDDYHRIDGGSPVNALLQRLLALPPIPLHLVIISRRDPPLPLATLRAKGQMTEIRMSDLRFRPAEARSLLVHDAGFTASDRALAHLDRELEGWVVGLRLVSLAVRESEDPEDLLTHLHGGVQQTQEYLIQEVVDRQPPRLRDWLLKSAILDRFCASLCDAVCAGADRGEEAEGTAGENPAPAGVAAAGTKGAFNGTQFIHAVKAGNLFTIALDAQGRWFRFHHLFQALLLSELRRRTAAKEIAGLRARASRWFEGHGIIDEAIRHALDAGDSAAAAEVVERHWRAELDQDRWYIAKDWLDRLPAEIKQQRPGLLLAEAWIARFRWQFEDILSILDQLESLLDGHVSNPQVTQSVNFFHGMIDYWKGNGKTSVRYLEKAIEGVPEHPGIMEGDIGLHFGLVLCMNGQRTLAIRKLNNLMSGFRLPAGYRSQLIGGLICIHLLCGELAQAAEQTRALEALVKDSGLTNTKAWNDYLRGCIHLHTNELDAALHQFASAVRQLYVLEPKGAIDTLAGTALTQTLLGQSGEADKTLDQLDTFARELGLANHQLLADSCRTRIQLLRGEIPAAHWARSLDPAPSPNELFSWLEVPAITHTRLLLAFGSEGSLRDASNQLGTLRDLSEAYHFTCQSIEVAVLQALVLEKQGRAAEALDALEESVAMAAPGGWLRPFVEAGNPMAGMLERLAGRIGHTEQLGAILDAVRADRKPSASMPSPPKAAREIWLNDALTRRELEILALLAQRLQNKEIASRLFVSLDTVKTHLKNLYQKLGVSNRREAAAKAGAILTANPPAPDPVDPADDA